MTTLRNCGDCTACCEVLAVPALGKSGWCRCKNQCSSGCAVYHARPSDCRDFVCGWLVGYLDEEDRPDRLGLIFAKPDRSTIHIFETSSNSSETEVAQAAIKRITVLEPECDLEIITWRRLDTQLNRGGFSVQLQELALQRL